MMQIYNNPLLLDFLRVCVNLPQDERDQLKALTGYEYDVDGAAIGNYSVPGPKWVAKVNDEAVCIGGFVPQRPGVWRDFMLSTPTVWEHGFQITRICRKAINHMLANGAHRLECVVPALRLAYRPEIEKWYTAIGYKREASLWRFCADGSDAVMFSRVRN
jgi:hypothetical protein